MNQAPSPQNTKKPMAPMMAASARPWLTGDPNSTTGRTNTGRASRPPMPRKEKAVSPPTASVASMPLVASMRNWAAAPAAAPPGTMSEMALPASWAVITENHALVRRAMRWREKVQMKWTPSASKAGMNQSRLRVTSRGQAWNTSMTSGSTRYSATPATTTTINRLTSDFHGKGVCCCFSNWASNERGLVPPLRDGSVTRSVPQSQSNSGFSFSPCPARSFHGCPKRGNIRADGSPRSVRAGRPAGRVDRAVLGPDAHFTYYPGAP